MNDSILESTCPDCGVENDISYDGSQFTRDRPNEPEVTVEQWQPVRCNNCHTKFALLTDEVTESAV